MSFFLSCTVFWISGHFLYIEAIGCWSTHNHGEPSLQHLPWYRICWRVSGTLNGWFAFSSSLCLQLLFDHIVNVLPTRNSYLVPPPPPWYLLVSILPATSFTQCHAIYLPNVNCPSIALAGVTAVSVIRGALREEAVHTRSLAPLIQFDLCYQLGYSAWGINSLSWKHKVHISSSQSSHTSLLITQQGMHPFLMNCHIHPEKKLVPSVITSF